MGLPQVPHCHPGYRAAPGGILKAQRRFHNAVKESEAELAQLLDSVGARA